MFAGLTAMRERCPACGHRFMREEGFFQGAMYISYSVAFVEFALFAAIAYNLLGPRIGVVWALAVALAAHLFLVPQLFKYSRVVWAHLNVGTGARSDPEIL